MSYITLPDDEFSRLSTYIEVKLGIRMPPAKKQLLEARLQKRLRHHKLKDFKSYRKILFESKKSMDEISFFIDEVTTNKTDFFREPEHFNLLKSILKKKLAVNRKSNIDIWSVASSSGEEPYTIAMVCEELRLDYPDFNYSILGTDISSAVLKTAVRAVYSEKQADSIPEKLMTRYMLQGKRNGSQEGFGTLYSMID